MQKNEPTQVSYAMLKSVHVNPQWRSATEARGCIQSERIRKRCSSIRNENQATNGGLCVKHQEVVNML